MFQPAFVGLLLIVPLLFSLLLRRKIPFPQGNERINLFKGN